MYVLHCNWASSKLNLAHPWLNNSNSVKLFYLQLHTLDRFAQRTRLYTECAQGRIIVCTGHRHKINWLLLRCLRCFLICMEGHNDSLKYWRSFSFSYSSICFGVEPEYIFSLYFIKNNYKFFANAVKTKIFSQAIYSYI